MYVSSLHVKRACSKVDLSLTENTTPSTSSQIDLVVIMVAAYAVYEKRLHMNHKISNLHHAVHAQWKLQS